MWKARGKHFASLLTD